MFTKLSVVVLFAGLAAAVHAPVGDPEGNPITAPLNEVVPAGEAYTITWTPTTKNTVSLLLLRGPPENVVPLGDPIAEGIENTGSYSWTPSTDLEADETHYGLQLIDDETGQYQYSTQFGISNDEYVSKPAESGSSTKHYGYPTSTSELVYPTANSTIYETKTSSKVLPTGYLHGNSSVVYPTKTPSVPATLKTTATETEASPTASSPPESTGAAAALRAGLGVAGAVAGLAAFML